MTWGELKLACLLEMGDATSLADADPDTIARMPAMANAGLQRLATVGRYIKKTIELCQTPLQSENLLGIEEMLCTRQVTGEDVSFKAADAKAYYFECTGPSAVEIYTAGLLVDTVTNAQSGRFTAYRGIIADDGETELRFKSQFPYSIRNVCLYGVPFASAEAVPEFASEVIYDLKDIAPDIFAVDTSGIVFHGGGETIWTATRDFDLLPDNKLRLNAFVAGSYRIPYFAYPQTIDADTSDNEELDCDPEGIVLLTYYICYHLYKGDEIGLATQWHNDFEEGLLESRRDDATAVVIAGGFDI